MLMGLRTGLFEAPVTHCVVSRAARLTLSLEKPLCMDKHEVHIFSSTTKAIYSSIATPPAATQLTRKHGTTSRLQHRHQHQHRQRQHHSPPSPETAKNNVKHAPTAPFEPIETLHHPSPPPRGSRGTFAGKTETVLGCGGTVERSGQARAQLLHLYVSRRLS